MVVPPWACPSCSWEGGNIDNPGGADFVPPPPRHVKSLLVDLADAMNRDDLPPVVQAALVQAQFETILPFEDGNGRTARVLMRQPGRSSMCCPRGR